MSRSFFLGVGAGVLVTALAVALRERLLEGGGPRSARAAPDSRASELQAELDAVREELARYRAGERLVPDPDRGAGRRAAGGDREEVAPVPREAGPAARAPRPASAWDALLASGDVAGAAQRLSEAFERGELTRLQLMQLAVANPGLLVAGLEDHALSDRFRSVLIDSLTSLEDPLGAISALSLEREPNQGFSSRIADILAESVDRAAAADLRAAGAIEKLLAGNEMHGEKINLYPVLAQLGAQGDARALALLQGAELGIFSPGIRSLLDPPARDERGQPLTGALVYSIQYNKGQWGDRPVQLEWGDIVVSLGGERVTCAQDFSKQLTAPRASGASDFLEAGVLRPSPGQAGRFEFRALQLDPGDRRLLYGVYTVKRP